MENGKKENYKHSFLFLDEKKRTKEKSRLVADV